MSFKEKLLTDIKNYAKESKWEDIICQYAVEVMQLRPTNMFSYLYEKTSVKSKLDHTSGGKNTSFISQLSFYCSNFDPLLHSQESFNNRVIGQSIEKYQQQKIRRGDLMKIINIVLLDFEKANKEKIIRPLLSRVNDTVGVTLSSSILYYCVIYKTAAVEATRLLNQLDQIDQHLTTELFNKFLYSVDEQTSCIKMLTRETLSGSKILTLLELLDLFSQSALISIFGC